MRNLPRSMRDLADMIGLPATMALVRAYGGRDNFKVPCGDRRYGPSPVIDHLVEIMGEDAAQRFFATYGGERMSIPRCTAALRDERDLRIISAREAGKSTRELCAEYSLTERQIKNILNRTPAAAVQGLTG